MTNITIYSDGSVHGDCGKVVARTGQDYTDCISIVHPTFSGTLYYVQYKYNSDLLSAQLDAMGRVKFKVENHGYIKCQFVAKDVATGEIVFKSNDWNLIVRKSVDSNLCNYKYKTLHPNPELIELIDRVSCLEENLEIEEDIRYREIQDIRNNINSISDDIALIKEKLHIYDSADDYVKSLNITKVEDYLYNITYDEYDYSDGYRYYMMYKPYTNNCASVHYGKKRGFNMDSPRDEIASFVIHTTRIPDRLSSISVARGTETLTNSYVYSQYYDVGYRYLPFMVTDGMNESGLIVTIASVPAGDNGYTIGTKPSLSDSMCVLMTPRFLLDKANTVEEAIALLNTKNIYGVLGNNTIGEYHLMLSDASGRECVIEFVTNPSTGMSEMKILDDEYVMTNFYLNNYTGERDTLTPHSNGIERYEIIKNYYGMGESIRGMLNLMKKVYYSQMYDLYMPSFWYSDYAGNYGLETFGDLTKDNIGDISLNGSTNGSGAYKDILDDAQDKYAKYKRDGSIKHTSHTSVYDTDTRTLTIINQEGGVEHNYVLL